MELSDFEKLFIESVTSIGEEEHYHKFSLRYKIRKRKIIKDYENSIKVPSPTHKIKLKYILAMIILTALLAACGYGIYKIVEGFIIKEYDVYSMLYIEEEFINSPPSKLENKFYIDMDMSDYTVEILSDLDTDYTIVFQNDKNDIIAISQETLSSFSPTRLNTEDVLEAPVHITVNGWKGVYYQTHLQENYFVFNKGDYIISYVSNLSKTELINIVKSTKFQ